MRRRIRIFVSHAAEDREFAERIVAELREAGFNPWISSVSLIGSHEWQTEIGRALGRCDWFLLVGSRSCYRSMWVKREISAAFRAERYADRILPIMKNSFDLDRLAWPLASNASTFEPSEEDLTAEWLTSSTCFGLDDLGPIVGKRASIAS